VNVHELVERLHRLTTDSDASSFRPVVFPASDAMSWQTLDKLLASGAVRECRDELGAQLEELVETREPSVRFTPEARRKKAELLLGGRSPAEFGVWVFYPWLGTLVHLLAEAAFVELRTNRNRYKLSAEEQALLRRKSIGIVGLSVGHASAVTLALEGVGGHFRLADFDRLSLSNLNRIAGSCSQIGLNKSVIAARRMFELDPFLDITIHSEGLSTATLPEFLCGLDLVIEECDDLELKFAIRRQARELRLPVLMETSDRGMLDVERFDLAPERPSFHGLVGEPEPGRALSQKEKVPLVLGILEPGKLSAELAASMVEIGETITTWPQLGSAVTLGGGLLTHAARRVLLDKSTASGRVRVDLDELLRDEAFALSSPELPAPQATRLLGERSRLPDLPPLGARSGATLEADYETLLAYAVRAPSGGNMQAWWFERAPGQIACGVKRRLENYLDHEGRGSLVGLGAATANLTLAARALGYRPTLDFSDDACRIGLVRGEPELDPLCDAIALRHTNRRRGRGELLSEAHRTELEAAARTAGGRLALVTEPGVLDELGAILGAADRLTYLSAALHENLMGELRFSAEEVLGKRDGVDLATLELTAADRAALEVIRRADAMNVLRRLDLGRGLERPTRDAVTAAAGLGMVLVPEHGRMSYFTGGWVLEHVWLRATLAGVGVHPLAILLYLYKRVQAGDTTGLSAPEVALLRELGARLLAAFSVPEGELPVVVLRFAYADPAPAYSLRRPITQSSG
jgi:molybdopterin/thiamine biosynthesis adenylyltransferase